MNVLSQAERKKLLYDFNNTAVDYPRDKCVHELFEEQVQRTPDKTAVIACDKTLTYSELNEQANRIAHGLIEKGVKPGDIVAFMLSRKSYLIATMFGILKAGAAYMPIDPDYPQDRVEYMLNDSNAAFCVTEDNISELLDNSKYENPSVVISSESICYCIYTSGSTGKPKGTLLTHRNVVNYCNNNNINILHSIIKESYQSIIATTTVGFDIFVTESILPTLNGLTTILANEEQSRVQSELNSFLAVHPADVLQTTPSKMKMLISDKSFCDYLKSLKAIILGGEKFDEVLFEELSELTEAKIFNIYGPTEATVLVSNAEIVNDDITIGKPIANTQIYILDRFLNPVTIGVPGELCIAGDSVGAGYLNRPDLTAEKFVPNPFGEGRMYKTGDIAKWRADGNIGYIGRNDFQVKIRGLRIELGEIENAISSVDGIALAVVVVRKDSTGHQLICAFYTGEFTEPSAIRTEIAKKLPKYMLPHVFTHLNKMPMTSSGKINRNALPKVDLENISTGAEYEPPVTEMEIKLCEIIAETLKHNRVGLNDDFFELGGDSLKAIDFVSKAHAEGIYFALQNVFDHPTIKDLCEFLSCENKQRNTYCPEDFKEIHEMIASNVDDGYVPKKVDVGDILITGATGFLGIHILSEYLESESNIAYCLVRGKDEVDATERFKSTLQYYFDGKYIDLIGSRIFVVCGDTQKENLGLNVLPKVQTVIHAAASVKHYGSYKYFYDINVTGTLNAIIFARRCNATLYHVSTLSVSGDILFDSYGNKTTKYKQSFSERNFYISQDLSNVYVRSKFEAEYEVLKAFCNGLHGAIMRVGNLTNRDSDGVFQKNYIENTFLVRMRAFLNLKELPVSVMNNLNDITPVDVCAKAILSIIQYKPLHYHVFHVNKKYNVCELTNSLKELGVHFTYVHENDFSQTLRNYLKKHIEIAPLINDLDEDYKLNYDVSVITHNEFTHLFLKRIGFDWKNADTEYFKKYLCYMISIGYFSMD